MFEDIGVDIESNRLLDSTEHLNRDYSYSSANHRGYKTINIEAKQAVKAEKGTFDDIDIGIHFAIFDRANVSDDRLITAMLALHNIAVRDVVDRFQHDYAYEEADDIFAEIKSELEKSGYIISDFQSSIIREIEDRSDMKIEFNIKKDDRVFFFVSIKGFSYESFLILFKSVLLSLI